MRRSRPARAPAWFHFLIGAAWLALAWRLEGAPRPAPHVDQAFFAFLIWIAEAIWQGLEGAAHITLAIVATSVQSLWGFARRVFNLAADLGKLTAVGFKDAWGFVEKLYTDILKPAWLKFWALVDRVRGALERALKPVLGFLRTVRRELLSLYSKWIRPVLDTIDGARKALRVLAALHLDFARKLDAQLERLEHLIDEPFAFALGKVNEIINFVNRIATADGLFQRLALVRSIQRDILYIDRVWHNMRANPFTDDDLARIGDDNQPPTVDDAIAAFTAFSDSRGEALSPDAAPARDAFLAWGENYHPRR